MNHEEAPHRRLNFVVRGMKRSRVIDNFGWKTWKDVVHFTVYLCSISGLSR